MTHARFCAARCEPTDCKQADQCARTTFRPRGGEPKVIDASALVSGGGWCSMFLDRRGLPLLGLRARTFSGAVRLPAVSSPASGATFDDEEPMPDHIAKTHIERIKGAVPPICGASLSDIAAAVGITKQRVGVCVSSLERAGELFTAPSMAGGKYQSRRVFLEKAMADVSREAAAQLTSERRAQSIRRSVEKRTARRLAARGLSVETAPTVRKDQAAARAASEAAEARAKQERERKKLEQKAARQAEIDNRAAERLKKRIAQPTTAAVHVASGRGPAHLPGDPDLSRARVIVAPTPAGRFEHRGRVLDGFASMPPGCYEAPPNSCAARSAA